MSDFAAADTKTIGANNVAAIGNASGFVEPLEATALHLIAQQLVSLCELLRDTGLTIDPFSQKLSNDLFRGTWDEVRDFLALHYKFNRKLDTPYWQHCREHTDLGDAQPLVDLYRQIGPAFALEAMIRKQSMFEYNGYMILLIGQRVETCHALELTELDRQQWLTWKQRVQNDIATALPMRQAMSVVTDPGWNWPTTGV